VSDAPIPEGNSSVQRIELPVDAWAPALARRFVGSVIGSHPRRSDALIATSELVTNVVRHSRDVERMELLVVNRGAHLRIEVHQPGGELDYPEIVQADTDGRGLAIVASLSDRWGIESNGRVAVWFEITE
jgi:anti-sigma regulatory factor (Ser/Thr protein kinase)